MLPSANSLISGQALADLETEADSTDRVFLVLSTLGELSETGSSVEVLAAHTREGQLGGVFVAILDEGDQLCFDFPGLARATFTVNEGAVEEKRSFHLLDEIEAGHGDWV